MNLPLKLRHYADNILLTALYRSTFAKANGGLVRLLTGTDSTGKVHYDGLTMAAEVKLGLEEGTEILLPSDTPGEDDESWRLRVFLLLFSLDWLAQGDFGPFAASVSAKRPCFKCMWTASCPCAYLPAAEAAEVTHSDDCRGRAPRTHANTMCVVREQRVWDGTAALLKSNRKNTGIFSTYFASEYLLADFVRDSTIDIMHIFLCGVSRYLFSFVTDVLVPLEFNWPELQDRCRKHHYKRGIKPPVPEPRVTGQGKRASKATKMTAAETMYFTLARWVPSPHPRTRARANTRRAALYTALTSWSR